MALVSEPVARRVDNVTLTATTDFAALVREALLGGGGFGSLPSDCYPLDWVFRVYRELRGSALADRLSLGVADCLTAPEPDVRAQALIFFQSEPDAAGGDRIDDLLARVAGEAGEPEERALFGGVTAPMFPGADLEWHLRAASAARARRELRRPGRGDAAPGATRPHRSPP